MDRKTLARSWQTHSGLGVVASVEAATRSARDMDEDEDAPQAPPAPVDRHFGRFVLGEELGAGAMGRVFSAYDPDLLRDVAIKFLRRDSPGDLDERVDRFLVESRIASQLEHPGIVPIHELGISTDGDLFLVMRRIHGVSLQQALGEAASLPVNAYGRAGFLSLITQVCHAVGYAHTRGVVHRDLKPANIMLGEHGQVLVVDWGVARTLDHLPPERRPISRGETAGTTDTTLVGTYGYMAPEVLEGRLAGPRSDVFALGAMLFEVLCRRHAIEGDTAHDLIMNTLAAPIEDPRDLTTGVDDELAALCMRALSRDADSRFANAAEMAAALEAWRDGAARRERVMAMLATAEEALTSWQDAVARHEAAVREFERLSQATPAALPLDSPEKQRLHAAKDAMVQVEITMAETFSLAQSTAEGALALAPDLVEARQFLARAYLAQFDLADAAGDVASRVYYAQRVRTYDQGRLVTMLDAPGRVSLTTDPPGAGVVARPVKTQGVVWQLGAPIPLGRTPLHEVPLAAGSWILTIHSVEHVDTTYPVLVPRGGHWDVHATRPLRLLTKAQVGRGWRYIPEGPFLADGDTHSNYPEPRREVWLDGFLIREGPVTAAEYARFLWEVWQQDPEEALRRMPRDGRGHGTEGSSIWPLPGSTGWTFPLHDKDGDAWSAEWPIASIDWFDALACADRMSRWRGFEGARLVSELEFEKAARGVDGRLHPWGNAWDASLCCNLKGARGTPMPVAWGTFATDVSVYGVRDLAGGMRTWCREPAFRSDASLRPVRGGSWSSPERVSRSANRFGTQAHLVLSHQGLRLTRPLPDQDGQAPPRAEEGRLP